MLFGAVKISIYKYDIAYIIHMKLSIHSLTLTNFSVTFLCHQGPIIYQFMKIQAGGVQSPLIAICEFHFRSHVPRETFL